METPARPSSALRNHKTSVLGIHAGHGPISLSSQGFPAFRSFSRQGAASRPSEAEGGQDSS